PTKLSYSRASGRLFFTISGRFRYAMVVHEPNASGLAWAFKQPEDCWSASPRHPSPPREWGDKRRDSSPDCPPSDPRSAMKVACAFKEGLTEDERYAVADHAVVQLKERGDPWRLNEEAPTAKPPSTLIRTEGIPPTPQPLLLSVKPRPLRPGLSL